MMKQVLIIGFGLLMMMLAVQQGMAQEEMTRKERRQMKKKWRKEARQFKRNPLEFKKKMEGMQSKIDSLQQEVKQREQEVIDYESENLQLKEKLDQQEQALKEALSDTAQQKRMISSEKGLTYKVQIGAYESFNMNEFFQKPKIIQAYGDKRFNKYVIGNFPSEQRAKSFSKKVGQMGFRDAWVVPYIDGRRVTKEKAKQYKQ